MQGAPRELGPYRILGELGRGGMGVVYQAVDGRLGRNVALKTISGLADQEAVERFVREARAVARLRHPGVVQVLDAGVIAGVCFVALELVEGGSLHTRLERGPLPANEAAGLVRDLALAVHAAHAEGIVHRDLKPANVLLERDGRPRLADFGLARDTSGASLTETGVAVGTPAYMAPEQANADAARIGPATDVYGLGAVLYHCLAGSAPFQGGTGLAVMHKVVHEDVESPSVRRAARKLAPLARDLETICLKALEKRPEARYMSARALSDDLGRYLAGEAIVARPLGRVERARRFLRRNRAVALLGAIGLAALLAVVGAFFSAARADRRAAVLDARARLDAALASFDGLCKKPVQRRLTSASFVAQRRVLSAGMGVLVAAQAAALRGDVASVASRAAAGRRVFDEALRLDDVALAALARDLAGDPALDAKLEHARAEDEKRSRADALMVLAVAARSQNHRTLATKELELAIRAWPDCLDALWVRALMKNEAQERAAALEDVDRLIALDPTSAEVWAFRGTILFLMDDFARAGASVKRALELDPESGAALQTNAMMALKLGRAADARGAIERLRASPYGAEASFFDGSLAVQEGRVEDSVRAFEQACAMDPDSGLFHLELGHAYVAANRLEDARAAFEAVLRLEPPGSADVDEAKHCLAKLERR